MSFVKSLPYGSPSSDGQESGYHGGYYTCGPNGDTYYVWPAFNPDSTGIGSPPSQVSLPDSRTEVLTPVRSVKRRVTNNKKERRRTMSINKAFCNLRSAIPQIPVDTKLSKIKTLKLATSYIIHLMDILAERKTPETFGVDIIKASKIGSRKKEAPQSPGSSKSKGTSGRTGWPQHVWSLELQHVNPT